MRISDWSSDVCSSDLVLLVLRLVTRYDDIGGVDDDDVIASINVRREFRFVLATQTACDFAGHTTEDFALGVDHKPVTLDFMRLGHKGLHDWFLKGENFSCRQSQERIFSSSVVTGGNASRLA